MKIIDDFLNSITMYRLVLYFLIVLLGWAGVLSIFGLLSFSGFSLFVSVSVIISVSWLTNKFFSFVFQIPTNLESVYISALILSLIIAPIKDIHGLPFIFLAAVFASATKYVFAINKKHLFNPAALALFLAGLGINSTASWWVGTGYMLPAVLIGGILVVKKIRRWDLVLMFLAVALAIIFI